jgi:short-subunit dehydrogenase
LIITNPHSAPYAASKSAQLAFSRSMAADLRPHGIRAHSILPGKANTEGHPQKISSSFFSMSRIMATDVETVANVTVGQVGKKPGEIYVPKVLRGVAVLNTAFPVTAAGW